MTGKQALQLDFNLRTVSCPIWYPVHLCARIIYCDPRQLDMDHTRAIGTYPYKESKRTNCLLRYYYSKQRRNVE